MDSADSPSTAVCEQAVQCEATLRGHTACVWQTAWSADGRLLASCSADRTVRLWHCEQQWRPLAVLSDAHSRSVRALAFSPCGRWLASASFDGTACLWDGRAQWQCSATLEGHESEVKSVHWSVSGRLLATCSRDKSVWIWEVGGAGEEDGGEPDIECAAVLMSHVQDVKCVRWSPARDELASAGYDDTICLHVTDGGEGEQLEGEWNLATTLRGHESTVWSVDWSADGNSLVSGSHDLSVRVWQRRSASSWTCVSVLSGHHSDPVYSVSLLDLGESACQWLATGCGDNALRLFSRRQPRAEFSQQQQNNDGDEGSFSLVHCVKHAHQQDVNCVQWQPVDPTSRQSRDRSRSLIATAGDDQLVKIWSVDTGLLQHM